jgi:hypothetical protein
LPVARLHRAVTISALAALVVGAAGSNGNLRPVLSCNFRNNRQSPGAEPARAAVLSFQRHHPRSPSSIAQPTRASLTTRGVAGWHTTRFACELRLPGGEVAPNSSSYASAAVRAATRERSGT